MDKDIRRIETPAEFSPAMASEDTVFVIIDVFMYSSTVVTLFNLGIEEVIPVYEEEDLKNYRDSMMIGGERSSDFVDFSNSPQDVYGKFGVMDEVPRTVALNSHNGAKRTLECVDAIEEEHYNNSSVVVGSTMNSKAVADYIDKEHPEGKVVLVCSGHEGSGALEDIVGSMLISQHLREETIYTDEYKEMLGMLPVGMLESPENHKWLSDEDLHHIRSIDSVDVVPMYDFETDRLVKWREYLEK